LNELEVFVRVDIGRALKQHVLEKVRESRAAFAFVRRANVIPQVHGDDGRRVVLGERDK
jgi:hypothetical protein